MDEAGSVAGGDIDIRGLERDERGRRRVGDSRILQSEASKFVYLKSM